MVYALSKVSLETQVLWLRRHRVSVRIMRVQAGKQSKHNGADHELMAPGAKTGCVLSH